MNVYAIDGESRYVGSIGAPEPFRRNIAAKNAPEAYEKVRAELYDQNREHVHVKRLARIEDDGREFVYDAMEYIHAANALPDTEAKLAEAVELLETTKDYLLANVPKGGVRKAFHELNDHACRVKSIRAFLDKVKA